MLAFPDSNYDGFKVKSQSTLRLGTYNLSLEIDDEFMRAVERHYADGTVEVIHKRNDYNSHIVEYDVTPIELYKLMVETSYDYAEPGALFTERFRNYNLMEYVDGYEIETYNPCKPNCMA